MSNKVQFACGSEVLTIPLTKILPVRKLDEGIRWTSKYKCIEASLRELGLIEPLVVFPQANSDGGYMLLDGHIRRMILAQLGEASAKCLIATDDEGFTYNHKVSRLSAVQEHFMILRAIKNGVSEIRIANSLNVDVSTIRQKRNLLDGICPEAVELLKERRAPTETFRELRKVKPMRQIEIAELLCAACNFTAGYTKCLVAATSPDQMIDGERSKETRTLTPEEISRLEHEMQILSRDFKVIEESHGKNVLNLVIVVAYLRNLLKNHRIVKYLSQNYFEVHAEFQKLVEMKRLADAAE